MLHIWQRLESPYLDAAPPQQAAPQPYRPPATLAFAGPGPSAAAKAAVAAAATAKAKAALSASSQQPAAARSWQQQWLPQQLRQQQQQPAQVVPKLVVSGPSIAVAAANGLLVAAASAPLKSPPRGRPQAHQQQQEGYPEPTSAAPPQPAVPYKKQRHAGTQARGPSLCGTHSARPQCTLHNNCHSDTQRSSLTASELIGRFVGETQTGYAGAGCRRRHHLHARLPGCQVREA